MCDVYHLAAGITESRNAPVETRDREGLRVTHRDSSDGVIDAKVRFGHLQIDVERRPTWLEVALDTNCIEADDIDVACQAGTEGGRVHAGAEVRQGVGEVGACRREAKVRRGGCTLDDLGAVGGERRGHGERAHGKGRVDHRAMRARRGDRRGTWAWSGGCCACSGVHRT